MIIFVCNLSLRFISRFGRFYEDFLLKEGTVRLPLPFSRYRPENHSSLSQIKIKRNIQRWIDREIFFSRFKIISWLLCWCTTLKLIQQKLGQVSTTNGLQLWNQYTLILVYDIFNPNLSDNYWGREEYTNQNNRFDFFCVFMIFWHRIILANKFLANIKFAREMLANGHSCTWAFLQIGNFTRTNIARLNFAKINFVRLNLWK